jgi:hypothetical protein
LSASFYVVSGDSSSDNPLAQDTIVSEVAETFQVDRDGPPGGIGLTLKLLSNTQLITTDFDMLVDIYDLGLKNTKNSYTVPTPADPTGKCDDLENGVPFARARFDTHLLTEGTDTPVRVNFSAPSGLQGSFTTTDQYVFIAYMEQPGINRVGIAGNDDSVKYYVQDYVQGNPPIGSEYQRQERVLSPGCFSNPPFIQDAVRDLNFFLTIGDGCTIGDEYACGTGACYRTIPECDAYGNFNTCVPGYCSTDSDCVWDWNNPNRGSYGGQPCMVSTDCPYGQACTAGVCTGICNNPSGQPYQGLCQSNPPVNGSALAGVPETCNGVDDDCDGVTDDNLGNVTCGLGNCNTSVYSCTPYVGTDGFLHGTATNCPAFEPASSPETCNGEDDDCDGITDDHLTDTGLCGSGPCRRSQYSCVLQSGSWASTSSCPPWLPGTESCVVSPPSATPYGNPAACTPNLALASSETCNGLDDDCDSVTDDWGPSGQTCSQASDCGTGPNWACVGGQCVNHGTLFQYYYPPPSQADITLPNYYQYAPPGFVQPVPDAPSPNPPPAPNEPTGPIPTQGLCQYGHQLCSAVPGSGVASWSDDASNPPVTPVPEYYPPGTAAPSGIYLCDGQDNDCDGYYDNLPGTSTPMFRPYWPNSAYSFPVATGTHVQRHTGQCQDGVETCYFYETSQNANQPDTNGASDAPYWRVTTQPVTPSHEVCNGLDDDCNGQTDEGLGSQTCGVGVCAQTILTCFYVPGQGWQGLDANCSSGGYTNQGNQAAASTEVCNGLDDDCDGYTDNIAHSTAALQLACHPLCDSYMRDSQGNPICVYKGGTQAQGMCRAGESYCETNGTAFYQACGTYGAPAEVGPSSEVCNGLDDDCDGYTDNAVPNTSTPLTTAFLASCGSYCVNTFGPTKGQCVPGTATCDLNGNNGLFGMTTAPVGPSTEVCNGYDDDCDGWTDNIDGTSTPLSQYATWATDVSQGLVPTCGTIGTGDFPFCNIFEQLGQCRAGTQICNFGSFNTATGMVGPSTELCNGYDDDCDGYTDNVAGSPFPITQTAQWSIVDCNGYACNASTASGQCRAGSQTCESASWSAGGPAAAGYVGPSTEACNGFDDDCDGYTDNAVAGTAQFLATIIFPATGSFSQPTYSPYNGQCRPGTAMCDAVVGTAAPTGWGPWTAGPYANGQVVFSNGSYWMTQSACTSTTNPGTDHGCGWYPVTYVGQWQPNTVYPPNVIVSNGFYYYRQAGGSCTSGSDLGPIGGQYYGEPGSTCNWQPTWNEAQYVPSGLYGTRTNPVPPSTDICNGFDDDCDGWTDNVPGSSTPLTTAFLAGCGSFCVSTFGPTKGQCLAGTGTCDLNGNNGLYSTSTAPVGPSTELCNGLDDDCDGYTDNVNGYSTALSEPSLWFPGDCNGYTYCNQSTATGQCKPGTQGCSGGVWVGTATGFVGPSTELCNGFDDDCDGYTDNQYPGSSTLLSQNASWSSIISKNWETLCGAAAVPFTTSLHVSPYVSFVTSAGQTYQLVSPTACVTANPPPSCTSGNTCTDGAGCQWLAIPEGPFPYCVTNTPAALGQCSAGTQSCTSPFYTLSTATAIVGPSTDLCNGFDDDCDGYTDNVPGTRTKLTTGVSPLGTGTNQLNVPFNTEGMWSFSSPLGQCRLGTATCDYTMIDGVYTGSTNPVEPSIELCNGLDDDCDGYTDNVPGTSTRLSTVYQWSPAACDSFPFCNTALAVGQCKAGTSQCQYGAWDGVGTTAGGFIGPSTDVCNGLDDDCDGYTDNVAGTSTLLTTAFYPPPGSAPTYSPTSGQCRLGTGTCDFMAVGQYSTSTAPVGPSTDVCNGYDDDCDGWTDNVPGFSTHITTAFFPYSGNLNQVGTAFGAMPTYAGNIGQCKPGTGICDLGSITGEYSTGTTLPVQPSIDTCNGYDDDCDGWTDNVPGTSTFITTASLPLSTGSNGYSSTFGAVPTYGATHGQCRVGTAQCDFFGINGVYSNTTPSVNPSVESCNGYDDDCDGFTDNIPGTTATLSQSASWSVVVASGWAPTCGTTGTGDFPYCNTGAALGQCNAGTQSCTSAGYLNSTATGIIPPSSDTCNGFDDDCDGYTDNVPGVPTPAGRLTTAAFPTPGTGSYSPYYGQCRLGTSTCDYNGINGQYSLSTLPVGPSAEICNGFDDDCDGYTDNINGTSTPISENTPWAVDIANQWGGAQACGSASYPFCKTATAVGQCNGGTQSCTSINYVSSTSTGVIPPSGDFCNGFDDDCDGYTDNVPGTGTFLSNSLIPASTGTNQFSQTFGSVYHYAPTNGQCRLGTGTCDYVPANYPPPAWAPWVLGATYNVAQVVSYNGGYYEAQSSCTSTSPPGLFSTGCQWYNSLTFVGGWQEGQTYQPNVIVSNGWNYYRQSLGGACVSGIGLGPVNGAPGSRQNEGPSCQWEALYNNLTSTPSGIYGTSTNPVPPSIDICNGYDDDCDGWTDNYPGTSTPLEQVASWSGDIASDWVFTCGFAANRGAWASNTTYTGLTSYVTFGGNTYVATNHGTCVSNGTSPLNDSGCTWVQDFPSCKTSSTYGQCFPGTQSCVVPQVGWNTASGAILPSVDTCNGFDDDCDGYTDNVPGSSTTLSTAFFPASGGLNQFGTAFGAITTYAGNQGQCKPGTGFCDLNGIINGLYSTGTLTSELPVQPSIDTCNGYDDDCDGYTDNLPGTTTHLSTAVLPTPGTSPTYNVLYGQCRFGTATCDQVSINGQYTQTTPAVAASTDSCNGFDDDCDGFTDNVPGTNTPLTTAFYPAPGGAGYNVAYGQCRLGTGTCDYLASGSLPSWPSWTNNTYYPGTVVVTNPNNGHLYALTSTACTTAPTPATGPSCTSGVCSGADGSCQWAYESGSSAWNPTTSYAFLALVTNGWEVYLQTNMAGCVSGSDGPYGSSPAVDGTCTWAYAADSFSPTGKYATSTSPVGPSTDLCNGYDDDCDGYTDNVAGTSTFLAVSLPVSGAGLNQYGTAFSSFGLWSPTAPVGQCRLGTATCDTGPISNWAKGVSYSEYAVVINNQGNVFNTYVQIGSACTSSATGSGPACTSGTCVADNNCSWAASAGLKGEWATGQTYGPYAIVESNWGVFFNNSASSCVSGGSGPLPNGDTGTCHNHWTTVISSGNGAISNTPSGTYGTSTDPVPPSIDTCNGFDDDCDGYTDNVPGQSTLLTTSSAPTSGTPGIGQCKLGTATCDYGGVINGQYTISTTATSASAESCNGFDDDCDGYTDNVSGTSTFVTTAFYPAVGSSPNYHPTYGQCRLGTGTCDFLTSAPTWPTWTNGHSYNNGDVVSHGAYLYYDGQAGSCTSGGTGPSCSTGVCPADGGCTGWQVVTYVGGWKPGQTYTEASGITTLVTNGWEVFSSTANSCTSSTTTNGPFGTGGTDGNGTCTWVRANNVSLTPSSGYGTSTNPVAASNDFCNGFDDDCDGYTDNVPGTGTFLTQSLTPPTTGTNQLGQVFNTVGNASVSFSLTHGQCHLGTATCDWLPSTVVPSTWLPWVNGTTYPSEIVVSYNSGYWANVNPTCTSNGHPGVDTNCFWDLVTWVGGWTPNTGYTPNVVVSNGWYLYRQSGGSCTSAGNLGPTGTGVINDGTCQWTSLWNDPNTPSASYGTSTNPSGPSIDTCNGFDDDCDGYTDNVPGTSTPLTTASFPTTGTAGIGQCKLGTATCDLLTINGQYTVSTTATSASTESCNGYDDDCDGYTDNVAGTKTFLTMSYAPNTGISLGVAGYAPTNGQCRLGTGTCDFTSVPNWSATTYPQYSVIQDAISTDRTSGRFDYFIQQAATTCTSSTGPSAAGCNGAAGNTCSEGTGCIWAVSSGYVGAWELGTAYGIWSIVSNNFGIYTNSAACTDTTSFGSSCSWHTVAGWSNQSTLHTYGTSTDPVPPSTDSCNGYDDDCDGYTDNVPGTNTFLTTYESPSGVGLNQYGTAFQYEGLWSASAPKGQCRLGTGTCDTSPISHWAANQSNAYNIYSVVINNAGGVYNYFVQISANSPCNSGNAPGPGTAEGCTAAGIACAETAPASADCTWAQSAGFQGEWSSGVTYGPYAIVESNFAAFINNSAASCTSSGTSRATDTGCSWVAAATSSSGAVTVSANGLYGTSTDPVPPSIDSCNGFDDDCDGYTDNIPGSNTPMTTATSYLCGCWNTASADSLCGTGNIFNGSATHVNDTNTCQPGVGICTNGTTNTCIAAGGSGNALWTVNQGGEVGPTWEACNNKDDDCDGVTDDGFEVMNNTNSMCAVQNLDFSTTTSSFTQPAVNSSQTVTVSTSNYLVAGDIVRISTGGYYSVASVVSSTSLSLTNLGRSGNAAVSSTVAAGTLSFASPSYAVTSAAFTQPSSIGGTVTASFTNNATSSWGTSWMTNGMQIYCYNGASVQGGWYSVGSPTSTTSAPLTLLSTSASTLTNPYGGSTALGGTVAAGTECAPVGFEAAAATTGMNGYPGTVSPPCTAGTCAVGAPVYTGAGTTWWGGCVTGWYDADASYADGCECQDDPWASASSTAPVGCSNTTAQDGCATDGASVAGAASMNTCLQGQDLCYTNTNGTIWNICTANAANASTWGWHGTDGLLNTANVATAGYSGSYSTISVTGWIPNQMWHDFYYVNLPTPGFTNVNKASGVSLTDQLQVNLSTTVNGGLPSAVGAPVFYMRVFQGGGYTDAVGSAYTNLYGNTPYAGPCSNEIIDSNGHQGKLLDVAGNGPDFGWQYPFAAQGASASLPSLLPTFAAQARSGGLTFFEGLSGSSETVLTSSGISSSYLPFGQAGGNASWGLPQRNVTDLTSFSWADTCVCGGPGQQTCSSSYVGSCANNAFWPGATMLVEVRRTGFDGGTMYANSNYGQTTTSFNSTGANPVIPPNSSWWTTGTNAPRNGSTAYPITPSSTAGAALQGQDGTPGSANYGDSGSTSGVGTACGGPGSATPNAGLSPLTTTNSQGKSLPSVTSSPYDPYDPNECGGNRTTFYTLTLDWSTGATP